MPRRPAEAHARVRARGSLAVTRAAALGPPKPASIRIEIVHTFDIETSAQGPACVSAGTTISLGSTVAALLCASGRRGASLTAAALSQAYACRADDVLTATKKAWLKTLLDKAKAVIERVIMVNYPIPNGKLIFVSEARNRNKRRKVRSLTRRLPGYYIVRK